MPESGPPADSAASTREARALELFTRALEQPTASRRAWLQEQCAEDPALLRTVLQLDQADRHSQGFLREPVMPPALDRSGQRVGAFELLDLIAIGGMSTVYRGRRADGSFRQDVAVKLIRADAGNAHAMARFHAERQILAALEHPGIARLIDGGTTDEGTPYVVMELIHGQPIIRHCRNAQLDIKARLRLFGKVCQAIQVAHEHGVVHRDIKAGNVLVGADGEPKVIDFGIAKVLQPGLLDQALPATRTRTQMLTPEYASPEQVRNEAVTAASDIYSLGVLLYEMLTGERPYRLAGLGPGDLESTVCHSVPLNPSTAVRKSAEHDLPGLGQTRQLSHRLRGDLDRIVMTALRKDPAERYASAQALAEDIERHLAGLPVVARGASRLYRARLFSKRHRVAVIATVAVVLLLSGALVMVTLQGREAARQRDMAQAAAHRAEASRQFLIDMINRVDPYANGESASLLDALKQSIPEIDKSFAGQPLLEADMRSTIGWALQNLGDAAAAEAQLQKALALRRAHGTPLDQADSLNALGVIDSFWGADYKQGNAHFAEALRLIDGDHSPPAASLRDDILMNWGVLLDKAGDYPRAKATFERAVAAMDAPGVEISDKGRSQILSSLAGTEVALKQYDSALAHFTRATDLLREAVGENHPEYGLLLNNLSELYWKMGRKAEAAATLEQGARILQATLGSEHPQVAIAMNNLATMHMRQGNLAEAETFARQALAISEKGFPPNHPNTGWMHYNLARIAYKEGKLDLARSEAAAAERIYQHTDAVDDQSVKMLHELQAKLVTAAGHKP